MEPGIYKAKSEVIIPNIDQMFSHTLLVCLIIGLGQFLYPKENNSSYSLKEYTTFQPRRVPPRMWKNIPFTNPLPFVLLEGCLPNSSTAPLTMLDPQLSECDKSKGKCSASSFCYCVTKLNVYPPDFCDDKATPTLILINIKILYAQAKLTSRNA